MRRILIISPMPPLVGGVAVSSGRLYDNLKEDGFDVHSHNICESEGTTGVNFAMFEWQSEYRGATGFL